MTLGYSLDETHIEVILGASLQVFLSAVEAIVYHIVCSFAVEHHGVTAPEDHRHPLADIVEVKDVQELVVL